MMRHSRWGLFLVLVLAACTPLSGIRATRPVEDATEIQSKVTQPSGGEAETGRQPEWWETAVFYEIFVRSFNDSDGDGIGDFNGITARLDYLNDGNPATGTDLGITALWLMPIFPSPSYHGYDVTDYYTVNPQYGSLDDFKRLLSEARKRGIRVIIDLVINHTSSQHPWFIEANEDIQSPYRDWYVWSAEDPGAGVPGWRAGKNGTYYANFDVSMPDLNFRNPAVTEEIDRITGYWLKDIGVDGFRIDAAKHLFEDGAVRENAPETYDWFKGFYQAYKGYNPQAYTVGEVYGAGARLVASYSGDKMDQVFNFEIASGIVNSVKGEAASGITSAVKFTLMDMPSWQFATFLSNHDQDRVLNAVGGSIEKAKVAATLLLTLPGTPFIYYGEEIGMLGVKPDEDIRRPMQWTGQAPAAGFTSGTPWRMPDQANLAANVADEARDADSLFQHYRRLIALRQTYLLPVNPRVHLLSTGNPGVFAMLRVQPQGSVLVLLNLSGAEINDYTLTASGIALEDGSYALDSLWDEGVDSPNLVVKAGEIENFRPLSFMAPYSTHIFQLK